MSSHKVTSEDNSLALVLFQGENVNKSIIIDVYPANT